MTFAPIPTADPLKRFSDRVRDYVKYRPSYPQAFLDFMSKQLGLGEQSRVADVGSGTGIFSRQLLECSATVFAVEPNAEMRSAAEELLGKNSTFTSIAAPAENTGLPSSSFDFVTAAQAFHWFDTAKAKVEWLRILKPTGLVLLIWNDRKNDGSEFLHEYEEFLMTFGTDYAEVRHKNTEETGAIDEFFAPNGYKVFTCPNEQRFDFEGLKGRLLSSSYAPAHGHPKYEPMLQALKTLFDRHEKNGQVRFEYTTRAYYGRLS